MLLDLFRAKIVHELGKLELSALDPAAHKEYPYRAGYHPPTTYGIPGFIRIATSQDISVMAKGQTLPDSTLAYFFEHYTQHAKSLEQGVSELSALSRLSFIESPSLDLSKEQPLLKAAVATLFRMNGFTPEVISGYSQRNPDRSYAYQFQVKVYDKFAEEEAEYEVSLLSCPSPLLSYASFGFNEVHLTLKVNSALDTETAFHNLGVKYPIGFWANTPVRGPAGFLAASFKDFFLARQARRTVNTLITEGASYVEGSLDSNELSYKVSFTFPEGPLVSVRYWVSVHGADYLRTYVNVSVTSAGGTLLSTQTADFEHLAKATSFLTDFVHQEFER